MSINSLASPMYKRLYSDLLYQATTKNYDGFFHAHQDLYPRLTKEDKQRLFDYVVFNQFGEGIDLLVQQYDYDINAKLSWGETALHYAILKQNYSMIELICQMPQADLNIKDIDGLTPLQSAATLDPILTCYLIENWSDWIELNIYGEDIDPRLLEHLIVRARKNSHLILQLINNRIDLSIPNSSGYTGRHLVEAYGLQCPQDHPRSTYETTLIGAKTLGHVNGIAQTVNIDEINISTEGFYPSPLTQFMAEQMSTLPLEQTGINPESMTIIQEAFASASQMQPADVVANKIQRGDLVILNAGWSRHAITLVFCQGIMVICNRGEGTGSAENRHTLQAYPIDPQKFSTEVLDAIDNALSSKVVDGVSFFYQQLPIELEPQTVKPETQLLIDKIIKASPKGLKTGTCTWGALKAAFRAALLLVDGQMSTEEAIFFSKVLSTYLRSQSIITYAHIAELKSLIDAALAKLDDRVLNLS